MTGDKLKLILSVTMAYEANSEENEQFKIPRPSTFQPEGTSKRGNYRTNVNLQTYGSLASRFKHVPRESMDLEPASDKNLVTDTFLENFN